MSAVSFLPALPNSRDSSPRTKKTLEKNKQTINSSRRESKSYTSSILNDYIDQSLTLSSVVEQKRPSIEKDNGITNVRKPSNNNKNKNTVAAENSNSIRPKLTVPLPRGSRPLPSNDKAALRNFSLISSPSLQYSEGKEAPTESLSKHSSLSSLSFPSFSFPYTSEFSSLHEIALAYNDEWELKQSENDTGLFREPGKHQTVDSLLRQQRKAADYKKQTNPSSILSIAPSTLPTTGISSSPSCSSSLPSSRRPSTSDSSLLSALTKRLTQVESQLSSQLQAISQKNELIIAMQKKIDSLQAKVDAGQKNEPILIKPTALPLSSKPTETEIEVENKRLRKQLGEMEKFLSDYGLIWVGDSEQCDEEEGTISPLSRHMNDEQKEISVAASSIHSLPFNLTSFIGSLRELNAIADNHLRITAFSANQHKFTPPPALHITLSPHSLTVGTNSPRLYTDPTVRQFIQDILDGYFPSELKEEFPEGVVMCLNDKTKGNNDEQTGFKAFQGIGRRLGKREEKEISTTTEIPLNVPSSNNSSLTPSNLSSSNKNSFSSSQQRLSRETFLSRLPVTTVVRGQIHPLRAAIEALMPMSSSVSLTQPPLGSQFSSLSFSAPLLVSPTLTALKALAPTHTGYPPYPPAVHTVALLLLINGLRGKQLRSRPVSISSLPLPAPHSNSPLVSHNNSVTYLLLMREFSTLSSTCELIEKEVRKLIEERRAKEVEREGAKWNLHLVNSERAVMEMRREVEAVGEKRELTEQEIKARRLTLVELKWGSRCLVRVRIR